MKPFSELTYAGQARRLRKVAEAALERYGLAGARLKLLQHGENTTFRVDAPAPLPLEAAGDLYVADRYLLRVHRPGYQSAASIASELAWLDALRQEAGLPVPQPVPALDGGRLVQASARGVPEPRHCSLLRWMQGRTRKRGVGPAHFRAVGRLMAHLHEHASTWRLPAEFTRRRWDREGLFGDQAGFDLPAGQVWELLPDAYREPFRTVAGQAGQLVDAWSADPAAWGLIHADLLLGEWGNVLFHRSQARPMDFDDCGFGCWVLDFAATLAHWRERAEWPALYAALCDGYARVRPLPEAQLAHLDTFIAARHVAEMLWAVDRARSNPAFREGLAGWLEWAGRHVGAYLERSGGAQAGGSRP